jgi:thioredoxin-related protein
MNYKNVWNSNSISEEYNVNAAPTFVLIDKEGKIIYTQIGHDSQKLKGNIAKYLNKTPPNKS